MAAIVGIALLGGGLYYWYSKPKMEPANEEEQFEIDGRVPLTHPPPGIRQSGHGTLSSSLSTNPGYYTPISDVDRTLYETQVKHLNIASRFAYG